MHSFCFRENVLPHESYNLDLMSQPCAVYQRRDCQTLALLENLLGRGGAVFDRAS